MVRQNKTIQSRRAFLKNTGCAALAGTTLFSSLINMKAIASAALDKKDDFNDYKALVCILLDGGADLVQMVWMILQGFKEELLKGEGGVLHQLEGDEEGDEEVSGGGVIR